MGAILKYCSDRASLSVFFVSFYFIDQLTEAVIDIYDERHVPGETVCAAGMARVIRSESHLSHIKQSF